MCFLYSPPVPAHNFIASGARFSGRILPGLTGSVLCTCVGDGSDVGGPIKLIQLDCVLSSRTWEFLENDEGPGKPGFRDNINILTQDINSSMFIGLLSNHVDDV